MNVIHLQKDFQDIIKYQLQRRINIKQPFLCEFGSFAYKKMPFGLKNSLAVFSRIVVKDFQEYIYKIMGVYLDD